MAKIILEKSWDAAAKTFFEEWEPLFKRGLIWGPYGPWEKDAKLLPPLRNKRVLVLGCGSGPDVWWLAKQGAKVTAADFSEKQLELAENRMKKARLKANFLKKDLNKLNIKDFPKNTFDLVVSNYAFQYIKDLNRLFAEVRRFLKKDGKFIFSLNHPVWSGTRSDGEKRSSKSLDYITERKVHFTMPSGKKEAPFYIYHRTVGRIINALAKNEFFIEKMLEPKPAVRSTKYYNEWLMLAKKIPATIIFAARKIK